MLEVEVSSVVKAPSTTVLNVYADYERWPHLFPTITAVRLVGREGPKLVLEVDHVEGKVSNELMVRPPDQLGQGRGGGSRRRCAHASPGGRWCSWSLSRRAGTGRGAPAQMGEGG
jgi:hypothetical protein